MAECSKYRKWRALCFSITTAAKPFPIPFHSDVLFILKHTTPCQKQPGLITTFGITRVSMVVISLYRNAVGTEK